MPFLSVAWFLFLSLNVIGPHHFPGFIVHDHVFLFGACYSEGKQCLFIYLFIWKLQMPFHLDFKHQICLIRYEFYGFMHHFSFSEDKSYMTLNMCRTWLGYSVKDTVHLH